MILDQQYRTISCDGCSLTVTFDVKDNQKAVEENPWLKTTRVVQQIFSGKNFCYHSDQCELDAIAAGKHNPEEPKKIVPIAGANAVAQAAAAAKAQEEANKAIKEGREVTLHGG